ncbi:MAG: restriction endonuclease [Alphaproteobacteria bacterium]|nr:restriction endonuclease [Alphaproteobacteria bacterium]
MAIPHYQSLMLPLLQAAVDGEQKIGELVEPLADALELGTEERARLLPSGRQTVFSNRVHWAKFYLAKAGLIEATRRGHFQITERGRRVLESQPDFIDNDFLDQFDEFREFRGHQTDDAATTGPGPAAVPSTAAETPEEVMRAAHQQVETALKQELLDRILSASPDFFETLIVELLVAMGYGGTAISPGRVLGRSGDGGVDGVIDQDALGLDRVYVQAKRYQRGNDLGAGVIRDFFGSLDRFKAAKGVLVTTADFTRSAQETAEFLSKRIVLINGDRLAGLLVRYSVGCRVEDTLTIKKVDEDFFSE